MVSGAYERYARCEQGCNHDVARGVLISELLGYDGPYPTQSALLTEEQSEALANEALATAFARIAEDIRFPQLWGRGR